jgi:hypothetical protein
MHNWQIEDLKVTTESILRGQGADPEIIRSRSPRLYEAAAQALELGLHSLHPRVLVEQLAVKTFLHNSMELEGGKRISGPLVAGHLAGASRIAVVFCTVGSGIDECAAEVMQDDMVLGLAVDGLGSAAVEALANAVCREIELEAAAEGLQSTIPLSPGMIGWSVEEGQPCIFDLADPSRIGISLTPYQLMIPRKSLSMMIGIGPGLNSGERICEYCSMRETCRYQGH